jgi:hypothetical protein
MKLVKKKPKVYKPDLSHIKSKEVRDYIRWCYKHKATF